MKNVWFSLLLLFLSACNSPQDSSRKLNPSGFEKAIAAPGVQVLDVRTAGEYQDGHIKNALLANWNDQAEFGDRIKFVDKQKPVYVYCLAGGRSAQAADWMRQNGFSKVIELAGGMNAWQQDNKPVEGLSNEPQMTMEQYLSSIPADQTVLVDFGAAWCPPCVKMNPVLDELQMDKDLHFQLVKIDAGIHTSLMKEMQIESIPGFIIYKQGKETWRKQGVLTKEELAQALR